MSSALARTLAPIARAVRNLVARSVVRLVDAAPQGQTLQVDATAGETLDAVEHWEPYGLTAHPQAGAEALLLSLGGSRARPVIIACADRRYRLRGLAAGEVALYDDMGQAVVLTRTGIELRGTVRVIGNLTATGTLTGQTNVVAGSVHVATHRHSAVTPGSGTSGVPV